jgi:hypothetical protein
MLELIENLSQFVIDSWIDKSWMDTLREELR